jgi:ribosome biogenesis GTPase
MNMVVSLDRGYPLVRLDDGREVRAQHSTSMVKNAGVRAAVGDRVELDFPPGQDTPLITRVLPRGNVLVRRALVESIHTGAGKFEEQVLAANVGVVLVVTALGKRHIDVDYLERQLVMAHQSGSEVAVLLTKADVAHHADEDVAIAAAAAPGCAVIPTRRDTGEGLDAIRALLHSSGPGVLLGRSGVGKSTLINELLGEAVLATGAVRERDRAGRHTTVARRMVFLDDGSALIDAPGLRSIGLYGAHEGLAATFPEIARAAAGCRYRDCTHDGEPGCAVQEAVAAGEIPARRLAAYVAIAQEVRD